MRQLDLLPTVIKRNSSWTPPEPPSLTGIKEVFVDGETSGLRWWDGDRIVGLAVRVPDGRSWYLPDSHEGGGNLGNGVVKRWIRQELAGKLITNLNTRFEAHCIRETFDIDLEELGCRLSDVSHYAALLDDHRVKFDLNTLGLDYLGEGKIEGLAKDSMAQYHAGDVAEYACRDVYLVDKLKQKMWPLLDAQGLQKVRQLEDDVIFPVVEMEKNGSPIDVPLLKTWCHQTEQQFVRAVSQIYEMTGCRVEPTRTISIQKLFRKLDIHSSVVTGGGDESFVDAALKLIDHPVIPVLRRARMLSSLRSKYLLTYLREAGSTGRIRYALHQLKAKFEEGQGGGTVTGRFSSSRYGTGEIPDGINAQQVKTVQKTRQAWGYDSDDASHDDDIFQVRRLFIPGSGLWFSGDADQIEYRLFGHYSAAPAVLKAYADNPRANFHKLIQEMLRKKRPDFPYRRTKDINFAKVYGAGIKKIAAMMEVDLETAKEFVGEYDALLPEVGETISRAMGAARSRGFVRTVLGRRSRFPGKERLHKALNSVIQGGAADINKIKLVELHKERKRTGFLMRLTVHDEVNGDVPDLESARMVQEILNRQSFELKVPITWSSGTGKNWAEAK